MTSSTVPLNVLFLCIGDSARSFTNSFSGISLDDMPFFIIAQIVAAGAARFLCGWLFKEQSADPPFRIKNNAFHKGVLAVDMRRGNEITLNYETLI